MGKTLYDILNKDNADKKGHWDYIAYHDIWSCSLCKYDSDAPLRECPNCSAEMSEEI